MSFEEGNEATPQSRGNPRSGPAEAGLKNFYQRKHLTRSMRKNFVFTKASTTTNESCVYLYDDTLYKNLEAFLPDLLPQHL